MPSSEVLGGRRTCVNQARLSSNVHLLGGLGQSLGMLIWILGRYDCQFLTCRPQGCQSIQRMGMDNRRLHRSRWLCVRRPTEAFFVPPGKGCAKYS